MQSKKSLDNWMYKSWWKWLGLALVAYALIAGLLIPLKPGILNVSTRKAKSGQTVQMRILSYNTEYTSGKPIQALLRHRTHLIEGEVKVVDDRHLDVNFVVPELLPSSKNIVPFSLIVHQSPEGPAVLPDAIFIEQSAIDTAAAIANWPSMKDQLPTREWRLAFPFRNILYETIRNAYYHVTLWFAMIFVFLAGVIYSFRYLRKPDLDTDRKAAAMTSAGLLFGLMGLITGAIWAQYAWGKFWSNDIKQITTLISLLIYGAYFVLRAALQDQEARARVGAVYNLFAFAALIPLIYVIPRLSSSLHPGAGGNPALGGEDLDNTMRLIFYPAIIGWTLLAFWIATLQYRAQSLKERWLEIED